MKLSNKFSFWMLSFIFLTVTGCLDDNDILDTVVADFEYNIEIEQNQAVITFTNQSTNGDTYLWTFPNGTPSSSTNETPSTVYVQNGTYAISLEASNSTSSDTKTIEITIDGIEVNDEDYISLIAPGCTPDGNNIEVDYTFSGTDANGYNTYSNGFYNFRFEDGQWGFYYGPTSDFLFYYNTVPTSPNPPATGWELASYGEVYGCNETITLGGNVDLADPDTMDILVANFTTDIVVNQNQAYVTLTNTSANADSYSWSFEGASPSSSLEAHPTITYTQNGVYTITLIASNSMGSATKTTEVTIDGITSGQGGSIVVHGADCYIGDEQQDFVYNYIETDNNGYNKYGLGVFVIRFENGQWGLFHSFNNNELLVFYNDNATYPDPPSTGWVVNNIGNYVCPEISLSGDVIEVDDTNTMVIADFEVNTVVDQDQATVTLTNTSQNANTYLWSFPNAIQSFSTEENPTINYSQNGTYLITLEAFNGSTSDIKIIEITIDGIDTGNSSGAITLINPGCTPDGNDIALDYTYSGTDAAGYNTYNNGFYNFRVEEGQWRFYYGPTSDFLFYYNDNVTGPTPPAEGWQVGSYGAVYDCNETITLTGDVQQIAP